MIVKGFQLLGVLFPIVVIVSADYFLKDVTPATPIYSGAASFMGVLGVTVIASMVYFVTVIPTSFILFKRENRDYFKFQNIGWKSVMFLNWAVCSVNNQKAPGRILQWWMSTKNATFYK